MNRLATALYLEAKAHTCFSNFNMNEQLAYCFAYPRSRFASLAGKVEDDYVTWVMDGKPKGGLKTTKKYEAAPQPTTWWASASPLERHAYLTGFPESKNIADKPTISPKIANREEFHKASAAFHRGVFARFKNNLKFDDLRSAHKHIQTLHEKAIKDLLMKNKYPEDSRNTKAYNDTLESAKKATEKLEDSHTEAGLPIGVGHTRYVAKGK